MKVEELFESVEILLEKINKSEYADILNDRKFRVGLEFEYVDNDLKELMLKFDYGKDEAGKVAHLIFIDKRNTSFLKDAKFGGYHANMENNTSWRVESDSSLPLGGVEIITPTTTLKQAISNLKKVTNYIKKHGNTKTKDGNIGLHINISYKGNDVRFVDVTKMLLFLEEGTIYKKFPERIGNKYAKSMKDIYSAKQISGKDVRDTFKWNQDLKKIQTLSKKLINKEYDKFYGINFTNITADNGTARVEFRYLGGEKYESKFEDIKTNMLRFAYLLKLGVEPNYKKDEYLRKLGKFLAKNTDLSDVPDYRTFTTQPYAHDKYNKLLWFIDRNKNVFAVTENDRKFETKVLKKSTYEELSKKIKKYPKKYVVFLSDADIKKIDSVTLNGFDKVIKHDGETLYAITRDNQDYYVNTKKEIFEINKINDNIYKSKKLKFKEFLFDYDKIEIYDDKIKKLFINEMVEPPAGIKSYLSSDPEYKLSIINNEDGEYFYYKKDDGFIKTDKNGRVIGPISLFKVRMRFIGTDKYQKVKNDG